MGVHGADLLAVILTIATCVGTSLGEQWVQASVGDALWPNAVSAGLQKTVNGNDTIWEKYYIGRAYFFEQLIPCKVEYKESTGKAGPAWGVYERDFHQDVYEVLTVDKPEMIHWLPGANGDVPKEAEPTGVTGDGEPLYTCRFLSPDFGLVPGVLQPKTEMCRINYDGEKTSQVYEVLVLRR